MALRFTIDVLGDEVIDRSLLRVADTIGDLSDVWPRVAQVLDDASRQQFDTEGKYGSLGWQPLASSTIARKAAKGGDPRILRDTGDLARSLFRNDDPAHVFIAGPDGMTWGTTDPKAGYHQRGTPTMPARPVVQLPEADRREAVKVLQSSILGEWLR